ncbi:hypothetical protein [Desulfospira joergensenii]|uniref:hypothetical protein n=1 Tax=Desulfospira joergensenii TaxID=53329 RepID=UPI0003B388B6|nr:hypothetical protein [Desulfospira joergensenii]
MDCWVCVDDTDMPGTEGTGRMIQRICGTLEQEKMGVSAPISRHQLFVHENIPFTSHNSAMAFKVHLAKNQSLPRFIEFMAERIEFLSRKGSDPGLAVTLPMGPEDQGRLIDFGKRAKQEILSKEAAQGLARELGIHLSEHGGTGQGIIGALAGLGLRLSGDDGRYRGWYHLGRPGEILQVGTLCSLPFIDRLVTRSGKALMPEEKVSIGSEKTKTVRLDHGQVVVVFPNEEAGQTGILYRTITKEESRQY